MFWEILKDTILDDTLKIIPILFAVYVLISYFSHNSNKYINLLQKSKKFGPLIGATSGSLPQCGFSVVMSDLYSKNKITIGTLIAVFIATSDEAIPLMISDYKLIPTLLLIIGIKFVYAIICGYIFDLIANKIKQQKLVAISKNESKLSFPEALKKDARCEECSKDACDCENCECADNHDLDIQNKLLNDKQETSDDHNENHHHCHNHKHHHGHNHCCADNIFVDAIIHTLEITAFVFVASLIINLIVGYLGTEAIANVLTTNKYIQTLIASVVGLIPNCVASVFLVELYMSGVLSLGALLAGLTTGAGVGLLVLFKSNPKKWKNNLFILLSMYGLGIALGMLVNLIM